MAAASKAPAKKPATKALESKGAKIAAENAEDIHDKRDEFTNPPVDAPVPVVDVVSEVATLGEKAPNFEVIVDGANVTVRLGGKEQTLDHEGVLGALRAFRKAAVSA